MGAPALSAEKVEKFARSWTAEVLGAPPLIAPARHFVYPQRVAGEEDALERGALLLLVTPAEGGTFLATCARGFQSAALPNGVWSCPCADQMLAVAGGYAYLVDMRTPETCTHLALRPVTQVLVDVDANRVVLIGLREVTAIGPGGVVWETAGISSEGLSAVEVSDGTVRGMAWNMMTDKDVPFSVRLSDGEVTGGVRQAKR